MSTSGSTNFTSTRNQTILDAFSKIGRYGIGKTVSAEDMALAVRALNKMIKAWEKFGLHLWTKTEGVLYFTPYEGEYDLSPDNTTVYFTNKDDEIITTLGAALAASETSLTVASTTGLTVADKIGVVLDDKTIHWTTIATIPTSTTLTITTGTASAAASGNLVYTFTSRGSKPLRITHARLVSGNDSGSTSTQIEIPMTSIGYEQYFNLSRVTTSSDTPTQFHYNPKTSYGRLYLWPRPSTGAKRLQFSYERAIEDMDNLDDNFDFPQEWLETIEWQLALRLCEDFGVSDAKRNRIFQIASRMLEDLLEWDREITSVFIGPNTGK